MNVLFALSLNNNYFTFNYFTGNKSIAVSKEPLIWNIWHVHRKGNMLLNVHKLLTSCMLIVLQISAIFNKWNILLSVSILAIKWLIGGWHTKRHVKNSLCQVGCILHVQVFSYLIMSIFSAELNSGCHVI